MDKMQQLIKGFRGNLSDFMNDRAPFRVILKTVGNAVYDTCCFGLDSAEKLSDDRYMIFYNQPASPENAVSMSSSGQEFYYDIDLTRLPPHIVRLVFTVSIDGSQTMREISSQSISIVQNGVTCAELSLTGRDFAGERAVIGIEIYLKTVWRVSATASGFNGGLSELLKESTPTPAPAPAPTPRPAPAPVQQKPDETRSKRVSLEKKLERAPELVSLAKPIMVQLEKKKLTDCVARVALVMDISGSMSSSYGNGTVQQIVNKILPLAVQFDDDGELDFWYYGSRCRRMQSVNLSNYRSAVPNDWHRLMENLGYGNNEPVVMREVIDEYRYSELPAYVIFVTDGGVGSGNAIKALLQEASRSPIFWQFVGVSGSSYGILKELDTMEGRYVDNANFFALDDFRSVRNEELYERLLNEFPGWLREIKRLGMI